MVAMCHQMPEAVGKGMRTGGRNLGQGEALLLQDLPPGMRLHLSIVCQAACLPVPRRKSLWNESCLYWGRVTWAGQASSFLHALVSMCWLLLTHAHIQTQAADQRRQSVRVRCPSPPLLQSAPPCSRSPPCLRILHASMH